MGKFFCPIHMLIPCHEDVGIYAAAVTLCSRAQTLHIELIVRIDKECGLAVVAALDHMDGQVR